MSDLIRREDVIKLVNKFVFGLCKEQNDEVRRTFNKYIEKMPTAYDIDKVVEELESELKKGNIAIDFGEFRLFEIVKQCGVSDDVCEWTLDGVYLNSPHKPLVSCVTDENYRYYYCPVCGKKVKVVE